MTRDYLNANYPDPRDPSDFDDGTYGGIPFLELSKEQLVTAERELASITRPGGGQILLSSLADDIYRVRVDKPGVSAVSIALTDHDMVTLFEVWEKSRKPDA